MANNFVNGEFFMTESEYIMVSNRVNITRAKDAIRDILPGKEYGITKEEDQSLMHLLTEVERRLFAAINLIN